MCIKGHLKLLGIALIMPVLCAVIVPGIAHFIYGVIESKETSYNCVTMVNQIIIPCLNLVWQIIVMSEYIDSKGNELFYVKNKCILPIVLIFMTVNLTTDICIYIYLHIQFNISYLEMWRSLIQVSFITAIFYCLSYTVKSVTKSVMLVLAYIFGSVFVIKSKLPIAFCDFKPLTYERLIQYYCPMLLMTVVIFAVGTIMNFRYQTYN